MLARAPELNGSLFLDQEEEELGSCPVGLVVPFSSPFLPLLVTVFLPLRDMQSGLLDDKMDNDFVFIIDYTFYEISLLAQLVERETVNLKVVGSTPTRGVCFGLSEVVRNNVFTNVTRRQLVDQEEIVFKS